MPHDAGVALRKLGYIFGAGLQCLLGSKRVDNLKAYSSPSETDLSHPICLHQYPLLLVRLLRVISPKV
jgi:hypothetical protein